MAQNTQADLGVQQKKTVRLIWRPEVEKTFLETCLHEVTINGREGSSLKPNSWKNVAKRLKTEHAVVPVDQQTRYRGRGKGECYQNVVGICDFDMIFTFVWAGWEGIAHDSRVLKEVAFNPNSGFPFPPPDKYYLCDAAYTNTRGFMTPYRNTRYWLADFRRQRALSKEERFNHAHAQLRNVIERAYGVLKARFPILKLMAPYPFPIQRDIVIACFAVHNFIRKYNIHDHLFGDFDENFMSTTEVEDGASEQQNMHEFGSQGNEYMANLRDQIANQLFSNASN